MSDTTKHAEKKSPATKRGARKVPSKLLDRVFIAIPFSEDFKAICYCVKQAAAELENPLETIRGDEISGSEIIIDQVTEQIKTSSIVVADITTLNANVFYELGYAHAIDPSRVIILAEENEEIPFDIAHIRVIKYRNDMQGGFELKERLMAEFRHVSSTPRGRRAPTSGARIDTRRGVKRCLEVAIHELKEARKRHGDYLLVYRAVAVEFTPAIFRSGEVPHDLLAEYKELLCDIVRRGKEPDFDWDRSIYGKSPNHQFNVGTYEFIEDIYFSGGSKASTSDLGLDITWNHMGFMVLGRSNPETSEPESDCCLLFYSDKKWGEPTRVSIIRDAGFAEAVRKDWYEGSLQQICKDNGTYWEFDRIVNDWESECEEIKKKFQHKLATET